MPVRVKINPLGDDALPQSCSIGHALPPPFAHFTLADHFGAEEKNEEINLESRGQPRQSTTPQQPRCNLPGNKPACVFTAPHMERAKRRTPLRTVQKHALASHLTYLRPHP